MENRWRVSLVCLYCVLFFCLFVCFFYKSWGFFFPPGPFFGQILCLICWACQSSMVHSVYDISLLWFLLPHRAKIIDDPNDWFAELIDYISITTTVHIRKYMKDQERTMPGPHQFLLKLSPPKIQPQKGIYTL